MIRDGAGRKSTRRELGVQEIDRCRVVGVVGEDPRKSRAFLRPSALIVGHCGHDLDHRRPTTGIQSSQWQRVHRGQQGVAVPLVGRDGRDEVGDEIRVGGAQFPYQPSGALVEPGDQPPQRMRCLATKPEGDTCSHVGDGGLATVKTPAIVEPRAQKLETSIDVQLDDP